MNRRGRRTLALMGSALGASLAWAAVPLAEAPHSMTAPLGPQAAHVLQLWNLFVVICTAVFAAIFAVLVYVIWRRPRAGADAPPDLSSVNRPEPHLRRSVTAAVLGSVLLLCVLIVASFFTDRALARLSLADAVNIEVTAHQWWWSARYLDGSPDQTLETANEIHIPVGRPVIIQLKSADVIHSLWVPNLSGKKDLVPGRTAVLHLRADQPGTYRGQCAEFCGFQHALMGLLVVADPPAQFDAWKQAQLAPAAEPSDPVLQRGQHLFRSLSCAMCHAVQGTAAQGRQGPDLTHVASRRTLAAGTLANEPGALREWIRDPQRHKPGVNMPATPMSDADLDALVAYLGSLK
jgi:cytochrome c oxidase subunit 2